MSTPTPPWGEPGGAAPGGMPPPPGPPGYIAYSQYHQPPAVEHPRGTTVLVLGILGLVVCGVMGPIAWSIGNKARREMESSPHVQWSNAGSVNAGRICGIVATFILLAQLAIVLVIVAAVVVTELS